jgi:long-chain acyl-CoA synthetase
VTRNLARLHEEVFRRRGDYPAVWFEGKWYRSGALFERGLRLSAGLTELGVLPGDRVVVLMENTPDVPVVYHAILRAGAVIVPAIFLLGEEELRRIVADAEPALVVASPLLREKAEAAGGDVRVVRPDELERADQGPPAARTDADLAALVYTGGTTGRAKGVMLTHASLWEAGRAGHDAGHVDGIDRSLTCLPLSHSFGLLVLGVGMHHPGRPQSVLMRWFQAEDWLELAQEHRTQIAAVVPAMLQLLLAQPLEAYDLADLRFLASGAAPLARDTIAAVERRIPGVRVREGYGLTESAGLATTNPPDRIKVGTVGVAVPGSELRLADDGEVLLRSPHVMAGYWNDPQLTAETLRDGWLHTGDIGRLDGHGYLTIVDRKKDLIIRGGFNVYPRDVEEALLEHPAVAGACVVGRPDPEHGEEVVAFVTLAAGAEVDADELVAFGRDRVGGYKYPREITILSDLPLTPVGKVDRKALRGRLVQPSGSEPRSRAQGGAR